jgi:hypothetical protein
LYWKLGDCGCGVYGKPNVVAMCCLDSGCKGSATGEHILRNALDNFEGLSSTQEFVVFAELQLLNMFEILFKESNIFKVRERSVSVFFGSLLRVIPGGRKSGNELFSLGSCVC